MAQTEKVTTERTVTVHRWNAQAFEGIMHDLRRGWKLISVAVVLERED